MIGRAAEAAQLRRRGRAREGPARRLGRDAPVQPLRAPADHGARPLPQPRRPDAVRRPARADLRHARPRRRRRPREGDPGRERAARRSSPPLLALSASSPFWRGEPTGLSSIAADGLRRLPALGAAAALQGLRRLRGGRRPAREDRLHRRLHAHLVGHPPAPEVGHGRDPDLRRGHAGRGRGRDHGVLPGARQALLRAARPRRADPVLPPDPDDREQVARRALRARGAGHGPRDRPAQPRSRRAADPPHGSATSSRTRASSAPSASSRGSASILGRGNGVRPPAARLQREPRHRRGRARRSRTRPRSPPSRCGGRSRRRASRPCRRRRARRASGRPE